MRSWLTIGLILACNQALVHGGDWLHWRGPEQNGVARDRDLPEKWTDDTKDPASNLVWKAPYGSRSTPLVSNGRVFLINDVGTGVDEQERIVCLDEATGKLLWEKRFNVFLVDIVSSRVGWTSLAADAETGFIYTHGTQGFFTCFDRDGKVIWQRSLIEECGRICGYGGRLSSPVVDGDLVILGMVNASFGDQARGANRFLAVDKRTGKSVWWAETGFPINDTYYSTPTMGVIGGQRLVISGGGDGYIHAFKVRTGEKVWSYPLAAKAINCSPVIHGNLVYIGNGEENFDDNSVQGLVACLDGSVVENGKPKLVWKVDEVKASFATPAIFDGKLYVAEENGVLFCFDAKTGKEQWHYRYGRAARGSPVFADGKIYLTDVNARSVILKPEEGSCTLLHQHRFKSADGSKTVVEVNGTPAIANGRIFLPTAEFVYCIGKKDAQKATADAIPAAPVEEAVTQDTPITFLQVYPVDLTLYPGQSAQLKVRGFDKLGRFVKEVEADWSVPAPPIPPGAKTGPPALKGTVSKGLVQVAAELPIQQGPVMATVGKLTARTRVRVVPVFPYAQDFEKVPEGAVPPSWINCAGKFVVESKDGSKVLRKTTANPNPLVAQAYTYFALPNSSHYTVESDVMGGQVGQNLADMGVVANRYSLVLSGNTQKLKLTTWDALPRIDKTVDWKWTQGVWYRMKIRVSVDMGKARVQGKVWQRDQKEPVEWTLDVDDPHANEEGAPGLFGISVGALENQLTPIWYDNVTVYKSKEN